jgi:hypothetical protein
MKHAKSLAVILLVVLVLVSVATSNAEGSYTQLPTITIPGDLARGPSSCGSSLRGRSGWKSLRDSHIPPAPATVSYIEDGPETASQRINDLG